MDKPPELTIRESLHPEGVAWLREHPEVVEYFDERRKTKLAAKAAAGTLTEMDEYNLEGPGLRAGLERYFIMHDRAPVEVKYHYPRQSQRGRRYVRGLSLQNMKGAIREILTWRDCFDIDMVNAHYTIYCQLCAKHNIPCPEAVRYVAHRDEVRQALALTHGVTQKTVKRGLLSVFNLGNASFEDVWVRTLKAEFERNHTLLCRLPEYAAQVECKRGEVYNREAKTVNLIICEIENLCLHHLCAYALTLALVVLVLMFDGLMLKGTVPAGFLQDAQVHVLEKTGYDVPLAQKPIPEPDWDGLLRAAEEAAVQRATAAAAAAAAAGDGRIEGFLDALSKWISVNSGMNSGKTYRIIEFIKAHPQWSFLFITPRMAQAYCTQQRCQMEGLPFSLYLDADKREGKLMDDRQICQYQSLVRIGRVFDCVIFDEVRSIARTVQCIGTNKTNLMPNWEMLKALTAASKMNLFLDADQVHDGAAYELQDALYANAADSGSAGDPILRKEYTAAAMSRGVMLASEEQMKRIMEEDLQRYRTAGPPLPEEQKRRIMIVCGSVTEANTMKTRLSKYAPGARIGLFTGEVDRATREQLKDLEKYWLDFDIIIFTSMLTAAADFNGAVWRAYLLPCINTTTPQEAHQQLGRARKVNNINFVVRWKGGQIRTVTRREVDGVVTEEKAKLVDRKGLVEQSVGAEQVKMQFSLPMQFVDGEPRYMCSGVLSQLAYSAAEARYGRSDSEWLALFMYIARRKGYKESTCALGISEAERAQEELLKKAEKVAEKVRRDEVFSDIDMSRVPLYSVRELAHYKDQVQSASVAAIQTAKNTIFQLPLDYFGLEDKMLSDLSLAQQAEVEEAFSDPVLKALVMVQQIELKAAQLGKILRFERTGRGVEKDSFMQREEEATGIPFGEYELKLLCSKADFMMKFPDTTITPQLIKMYEHSWKPHSNYMRLQCDLGEITVASSADHLKRLRTSQTPDIDYDPHMVTTLATQIVKALGFRNIFDTATQILETAITEQAVGVPLKALRALKVGDSSSKTLKGQVSTALTAAVGIKLSAAKRKGTRKRKRHGVKYCSLQVAANIKGLLALPNEFGTEHWYEQRYKELPPHLDMYKATSSSSVEERISSYRMYFQSERHVEYCSALRQSLEAEGITMTEIPQFAP
jgi:hypothetical protein